jgi:hypothetical protein
MIIHFSPFEKQSFSKKPEQEYRVYPFTHRYTCPNLTEEKNVSQHKKVALEI